MREIIKKRKFRVSGINDTDSGKNLGEALLGLRGITSVDVFREGFVHLEYDLTEIKLESIEKRIEEEGYGLDESLLGRLKRSFLYYSEQNEFDNQNLQPKRCCSSIPGEEGSCDTCGQK